MAFITQRNFETGKQEVYYTSDAFDHIFKLKKDLFAEVFAELDILKKAYAKTELERKELEIKRNERLKELGPDFSPFEDDSVLEEIDDEDWELTQQLWALDKAIYSLEDFVD